MSESPTRQPGDARSRRTITFGVIAVVAIMVAAVAIPLLVTSTAQFFERYHLLERRYVNLEDSAHEGIGCRDCHETEPLANGAALVGDFYRSLVTSEPVPRYFAFGPPKSERCLSCHEDEWSTELNRTDKIPHPAHLRVAEEKRECVSCHKWTAHLETYIDKHKEMPFSGVCVAYGCHVGTKTTDQCFDCHHVLHESGDEWQEAHPDVVRASGQSACVESCHQVDQCQQCHTTGERPEFTGQPIEIGMKAIEELHVRDDWTPRFHGPQALLDETKCLKCHQSSGECDECHRERPAFHGTTDTWIGRHSKRTKLVDDPGCLACHEEPWCKDCHDQFKEME
ncbi:MAG: hypothetical protein U1E26_06165 [Coriobacteriia bacterium]|nr:hypothetical protein [Coriobacteriia bacterium]